MKISKAVLLVAFGGPDKFEDVKPFLANVLKGHSVPQERIEKVVEQYRIIGGSSPLNKITLQQAGSLFTLLQHRGTEFPVYVGMRNWNPYIEDSLRRAIQDGVKSVIAVILSPFVCEASWTRYQKALSEAVKKIEKKNELDFAPPWYHHPLFIDAIIERISEVEIKKSESHWLFTAHSIPISMDKDSVKLTEKRISYSRQFFGAAQQIAEKCDKKNWSVAYQSRSGMPKDPWLEPDICDKIEELAKKNVKSVLVIPIGFVCDHVEVLYDLDIKARKTAENLGMQFARVATVGNHPKFIEMLADISTA